MLTVSELCHEIDARKEELFETLCELIRIPSENDGAYGAEKEVAEELHRRFIALGLESELYSPMELEGFSSHPDYVEGHHLENRYNVTARYRGATNEDELLLMGHSDTVVAGDLNRWDFDPFEGFVKDGKIFGRGAGDDKYALATMLFLAKIFKDKGFLPQKNLLLNAYCDEERGGSHGALAAVLKHPCPSILNMDGRADTVWHCGSGGQEVKLFFHTEKTADSAIIVAQALPIVLEETERFGERRRQELRENPFYQGSPIPDTALRYMGIRAGYDCMDLGRGEVFFVFYTDKTKAEIDGEFAELEATLRTRLAPLGIVVEGIVPQVRFFHYVQCAPDSADINMLVAASKEATGVTPTVCGSCLSDLSVISKYGSSEAFAYGAGREFSEPGGPHQPNEYMPCENLLHFAKVIGAYVLKKLG